MWYKRARIIPLALIGLAFLVISCSGQRFKETAIDGFSAEAISSSAVRGDVKIIVGVAQQEIQKYLPDAYLNAFVYTSPCAALPNMQGKFNLQFLRVDRVFLRRRYLTANVSIDANSGTMDIEYLDYTGTDLRTDGLAFGVGEIGFDQVAKIAHEYISALGKSDCDVTITRTRQAWNVRCGPIYNFVQECLFQIDPSTGQVIVEG